MRCICESTLNIKQLNFCRPARDASAGREDVLTIMEGMAHWQASGVERGERGHDRLTRPRSFFDSEYVLEARESAGHEFRVSLPLEV